VISRELPVAQLKAELFKAIGHPVRVRILEQLVAGERSVGALAETLETDVAVVSQQLAVLRRSGVVVTRREGTTVFYSLRDPGMIELLAVARRMLVANLQDSRSLLSQLEADLTRGPA
jgi:DNA-binding transcriptional ArsR family regulator